MGIIRSALVLSLLLCGCASKELGSRRQAAQAATQAAAASTDPVAYRISPGDSLRIEHPFNEELNRVVVVRPDGFVSLPMIPEVNVADHTLGEARGLIEAQYAGTVRNPKLTVALENAGNWKICVGGEVLHPGLFALNDGLTVLRAIAIAGGPRPTAKMSSVVILRDQGRAEPLYLLVDLTRVTGDLQGREDLRLHPRDMVFVPQSTIAKMNAFVDQYLNQLIPFSKNLGVTYLVGPGGWTGK